MAKKTLFLIYIIFGITVSSFSQINTDRVMIIGRNALYYEDYVLSIQYFNQVIKAKPYLAEPYFYRAIAKFYLDDIKGAEEDCTLSLDRNPFFVNAYQLRGDARLNLEDFDGALEDYRKALSYSPDNKFALINVGIANIRKKEYEEAEKELTELIRVFPNYVEGRLIRGSMYAEKGDTIKALADLDKAIEIDKYFYPSYSMRGIIYYGQKKYEDALADLDEAIRIDPVPTGNYINRGLIKYSVNNLRGAMEDYDYVIEKEPGNIIARFNRGLLRAQVGDDNRAIEDFDMVIGQEPDNYIAYLNRALLKQNISDNRGALADLDVVLAEYPDFYNGFYIRSEIKRKLNDLRGAERDYYYARNEEEKVKRDVFRADADTGEEAKEKEPQTREKSDNTIEKFNLLVVADTEEQEKTKYKNEARGKVQDRQVKIELEPKFVVTYYEKLDGGLRNYVHYNSSIDNINNKRILSRKLIITNNEVPLTEDQIEVHFSSINEFSKLIDENPNDENLYFGRALDYMLVQNFSNAIEDLNRVIELNPKFILAYFNLAVLYTKQLELKDYVPQYEIGNSLDQIKKDNQLKSSSPLTTQTTTDRTGDNKIFEYELILHNYSKVLELDPDFVYAYYNRGEIRSMQRDFRAAILDYNEVLRREPNFPDAYFNRGLDRLQLGERQNGLADIRKAGELGILNAYSIIKRMTE